MDMSEWELEIESDYGEVRIVSTWKTREYLWFPQV